MKGKFLLLVIFFNLFLLFCINGVNCQESLFKISAESEPHKATWVQWPHHHQFSEAYRDTLEPTWISMTKTLVIDEKVYIIAYDQREKDRITELLKAENISLKNIEFRIYKTDDVWIRDSGPIYVKDKKKNLAIVDFGFNGWGKKAMFAHCKTIPSKIAKDQGLPLIDLASEIVLEGGSIEIDGYGTLMACKSSILNYNRNPGMTQEQAEQIFRKYLGISSFIWLDGQAGLDISDQHIDGFARFCNINIIVTMEQEDLLDYDIKQSDINKLFAVKNKDGIAYTFVKVPLTKNTVKTTDGRDLGYKGSYINYYVANKKVLVPNYNDPNDKKANKMIQTVYPLREIVGIDVRDLYEYGGMVHCVLMQQPQGVTEK